MNKRWIMTAAAAWLAVVSTGWAIDQIRTTAKEKSMVRGTIVGFSPKGIEIKATGGGDVVREIPANEIVSVIFEDEPPALLNAQRHILEGDYTDALTALEKMQAEDAKRSEIGEEIEFCKAYATAQLALAGNGSVTEAGGQMVKFITEKAKSFHYYQCCELVGHLLVASGKYDKAEGYYAKLGEAPWPDYKMRAGTAMGRALLAQGKTAEAAKAFDEVLGGDAGGDLAETQRMMAKVGKARCMAAGEKVDQAIRILNDIIDKADADNLELNALAYNALGTALHKAGKPKEAVLAFLHVDLLYSGAPEAHAEALANLAKLFLEIHKPEHARRAQQTLQDRYKSSHWAEAAK